MTSAAHGHDPRPVHTCGLCKRTGTVGFHPKPHHGDSYLCVSRRACESRWRKGLSRV